MMEPIQFTVKFTKSGRAARDGCFVDVLELANGLLELTLRSTFNYNEIVDQKIVSKEDLAQTLEGWVDW
jgi:hypothetical protein